ncbi:MAG: leucine-rich repeat protein [Acutalibacteraceae bacterium]
MNQTKLIVTYFKLNEQERTESYLCGSVGDILKNRKLAVGYAHIALLNDDGTVSAHGDNSRGQCNTQSWQSVTKVAAGDFHTAALKSDGTVYATGDNTYGQCNVAQWRDITDIFADKGLTVGATADGELLFSGQTIKTPAQAPLTKEQQESIDILTELLKPEAKNDDSSEQYQVIGLAPTDKRYFQFSQIRNGGIKIKKYIGNSSKVVIPNEIDGRPVTEIGAGAFRYNEKLKAVVFPESLRKIQKGAFEGCISLETLEIPYGLTQISEYAFSYCESLRSLKLPDSVGQIDQWAFSHCLNLEEVYLPDSLSSLGVSAFSYCHELKRVYISEQTKQHLDWQFSLTYVFDYIPSITFIDPSVETP